MSLAEKHLKELAERYEYMVVFKPLIEYLERLPKPILDEAELREQESKADNREEQERDKVSFPRTTMSKALLDRVEKTNEDYLEWVDKIPTEDKIVLAHEEKETLGLDPWEISEIVQGALNELPEGLEAHVDVLFDVVYDAVAEAVNRMRR